MVKSIVVALALSASSYSFAESCYEFAYSKYLPELGTEDAPRFARDACKQVSDVKVLSFLWSKHAEKFSPAHSMDFATEERPGTLDGKYTLVEFSWEAYSRAGLDSSAAATKAAAGAARIDSIECLAGQLFITHGDCKLAVQCIDSAFDACEAKK